MKVSKILDKGLVVIPKEIRGKLNLSKGDRVEMALTPEGIVIKPLRKDSLTERYKGVTKGKLSLEELEELYESF